MLKNYLRYPTFAAFSLLLMVACQKTAPVQQEHVPVVYADSSRTIWLPVDSVKLNGSATDTGGKVVAWLWSEVSGPNVPVIKTEGSPSTVIGGLTTGVYVFQLMVLDSAGETGVNNVTITVNGTSKNSGSLTFNTGSGTPFELHTMSNGSVYPAPELDAVAWTVNFSPVSGRAIFRFDMSSLPAVASISSAFLTLHSNLNPQNGDLIHANSGSANAFYIQRVNTSWDPSTTNWTNQPATDITGQVLVPQSDSAFQDITVDVTTMVNNMIASGNYGFKIQLQNESIYNSRIFYSSAVADTTKHPSLLVNY